MTGANTFTGAGLDRAGRRRRDPEWVAACRADPESRAVVVAPDEIYLAPGGADRPAFVSVAELEPDAEPLLLGLDGERAVFVLDGAGADGGLLATALEGAAPVALRDAAARLGQADGGLVAYASALVNWHRRNGFCSVCGSATDVAEGGLIRVCPACGTHHHPRTDPVVIMLVTDGDRVLLGRQPSWPAGRYSALAGFVEPGESLEDAILREVEEEAGVRVSDPAYASSQPWPFPSSLMLGFTARYAGGELDTGDDELDDVRWFSRAELTEIVAGGTDLEVPPRLAIARRLIDGWLEAR